MNMNTIQTETKADLSPIVDSVAAQAKARDLSGYLDNNTFRLRPELIRNFIWDGVWAILLETVKKGEEDRTFTPAEVGALLIHRGVGKENVQFSRGKFIIQLEHSLFVLKRNANGKVKAAPCKENGNYPHCWVTDKDPEALAGAMLAFDSAIPQMEKAVEDLVAFFQEKALEQEKARTIRSIADSTLKALLEEYVTPLGLRSRSEIHFKDGKPQVYLTLRQVKQVHINVPLDELAVLLEDPETLLSSMSVLPPSEPDEDSANDYMTRMHRLTLPFRKVSI